MCRYALLVCVVQAYTQHRTGLRKGLTLWRKDRYWKHGAAVPVSLQKSLHRCTPRHAGINPNRKTHFENQSVDHRVLSVGATAKVNSANWRWW